MDFNFNFRNYMPGFPMEVRSQNYELGLQEMLQYPDELIIEDLKMDLPTKADWIDTILRLHKIECDRDGRTVSSTYADWLETYGSIAELEDVAMQCIRRLRDKFNG